MPLSQLSGIRLSSSVAQINSRVDRSRATFSQWTRVVELSGARSLFAPTPKVLAFYLAVLPQFLPADRSPWQAAPLALTQAAISALYLGLLAVHRARRVLSRQRDGRSDSSAGRRRGPTTDADRDGPTRVEPVTALGPGSSPRVRFQTWQP